MTPAAGDRVAGRWRLVEPRRPMLRGQAWVAHDETLDRRVALELAAVDADGLRRAAGVAHPNLVPLFDTGLFTSGTDVVPYAVRAICPGTPVDELLRDGPLDVVAAVRLGAQVADALATVHAAGLVHGAVGPATVWWDGERAHLDGLGGATADAAADDDVRSAAAIVHAALCGPAVPTEVRPRRVRAGVPRPVEDAIVAALAGGMDAANLRDALAAVDVGDDAVPAVVRDATPPSGTAPAVRRTRRGAAPVVVAGVLVAATAVVLATLAGRDGGKGAEGSPAALPVAAVRSLDPVDPGGERDTELGLAVDGDVTTAWRTERYRGRPDLGGLKPGVGLVLQLDGGAARVSALEVVSPTSGWAASVYVAPAPATALAGWGEPVASLAGIDGNATFDLGGREAGAVLLWITRLGPVPGGFATAVAEIRLTGRV